MIVKAMKYENVSDWFELAFGLYRTLVPVPGV
jgi:hypothetical protein